MEGILSQEEIDALLGGGLSSSYEEPATPQKSEKKLKISKEEEDAIGELGNISLGTSATTLSTLLSKNVSITTPKVEVSNFEDIKQKSSGEKVLVELEYKSGFSGLNLLLIDKKDAAVIGDLMMGNDGLNPPSEIDELYLSAIAEAMNQMMGSAATSISNMIKRPVDINPPNVTLSHIEELKKTKSFFSKNAEFVTVTFDMEIEGLIKTNLYQIMDIDFVKDITKKLYSVADAEAPKTTKKTEKKETEKPQYQQPQYQQPQYQQPQYQQPQYQYQYQYQQPTPNMWGYPPNMMQGGMPNMMYQQPPQYQAQYQQPVNVQPVQFAAFNEMPSRGMPANIDLIMDVQLQLTVELGRTKMQIREILDLSPGSIVELEKLAGEPVDVLVNGKLIAKGEVVVIDESFGVRITDIISQMERLNKVQ